jgi:hypothetical protein
MSDEMTELGTTGLRRVGGFVIDDQLSALRGTNAVNAWREMSDNDPIVGALLFAIEKLIMKVEWRTDPYVDSDGVSTPQDEAVAEFVESCRHDLNESWGALLQGILTMLPFGFSFHELVYKRRGGPDAKDASKKSRYSDGKIGWRKIAYRAQETRWQWVFGPDGGLEAMVQWDPSTGKHATIPMEKALLFRTTVAKANPEGRSILRNSFRPWYYKRRIEEFEAVGIERDLAGLPIAYVPPSLLSSSATQAQQSALSAITDIVQGIKRNEQEGVVFPLAYDESGREMFRLELLSSGGQRQFDTDKIISRYDQRIAMTTLSDFILLGHEGVGSFALGSSKIDLFISAVEAWVRAICDVFNDHAIPRLLKLNGMDTSRCPMLTYGELGSIDLTSIADFVGKLTQAGALIPDEGLENFLRDVGNLPPADHESPLSTLIPGLGMPEEMDTETVDTVTTEADDVATMRAKADALGILIRAGMEPEAAAKLVGLPGARFTGLQPTTLKAPGSE